MSLILPGEEPRLIRCYDKPDCVDRYTIVFTGNYRKALRGDYMALACDERPYHPQGFGQHCFQRTPFDRPRGGHLGRRVAFASLPPDVQRLVRAEYRDLWQLGKEDR